MEIPMAGLTGGMLIGSAAATLLLSNGDVLGISGMLSSSVLQPTSTPLWKFAFLVSVMATARIALGDSIFLKEADDIQEDAFQSISTLGFLVGGFFVGLGTKLGNGCTTGHGICGLGRESPRSLASVLTFMVTAMVTATLVKEHDPGMIFRTSTAPDTSGFSQLGGSIFTFLAVLATIIHAFSIQWKDPQKVVPAMVGGILFSLGLYRSGMILNSKNFGFLAPGSLGNVDTTLVFVFGGAVLVSWFSYQLIYGYGHLPDFFGLKLDQPLTSQRRVPSRQSGKIQRRYSDTLPTNTNTDLPLFLGAAFFGLGWGIGGNCPGPVLLRAAAGHVNSLLLWLPMYVVGSYVAANYVKPYLSNLKMV